MKKHILLVDDEAGFRFSAGIALRKAGYLVTEAANGREAYDHIRLGLAARDPVDLVVTDIRMPGMSGLELMEELRSCGIRVPLLAVTGFSDRDLVRQLLSRGCPEFIEKPFQPDELVARVEKILHRKEKDGKDDAPRHAESVG
jgi:phosphoserine phosphatase RsbU/P